MATSGKNQLEFCEICKHQKYDIKEGLICELTSKVADFEGTCETYFENTELKTNRDLARIQDSLFEKTAGLGTRFANYLLDLIFIYIFAIIFGVMLGLFLAIFSPSSLSLLDKDNIVIKYLLGFIIVFIYYTIFEASTGRSIAKYITKTKVVTRDGKNPGIKITLLRTICRFIPFEPLSFFGTDGTGWHDSLSKTIVIKI